MSDVTRQQMQALGFQHTDAEWKELTFTLEEERRVEVLAHSQATELVAQLWEQLAKEPPKNEQQLKDCVRGYFAAAFLRGRDESNRQM